MYIQQIFIEHPQLKKITEELVNSIVLKKLSINLDYNKTLAENGFDDLDCVELAMEIEKILDISIQDDILDFLFNCNKKPPRFTDYWRNKKLEDLGL
jgi:acyl carrier protein